MDIPEARFLVDGSLLRLGKYLRCLGCDATWHPGEVTRLLARRAEHEQRVLLTRSSRLGLEFAPPPLHLRLESEDPVEQLREVARAFALADPARRFTRCLGCNVELVPADPGDVERRAPAGVRERQREFFCCPECGALFWRGTHVTNTCRRLGLEP